MTISRRVALSYAMILSFPDVVIQTIESIAQPGPVRVRQNINDFVKDPQKVAALRAAVGKMKARTALNRDDPLGWYYWSAVHGTTDPVPAGLQNVYRKCEHTPFQTNPFQPIFVAEHFISWHRPYLFSFEAVL